MIFWGGEDLDWGGPGTFCGDTTLGSVRHDTVVDAQFNSKMLL